MTPKSTPKIPKDPGAKLHHYVPRFYLELFSHKGSSGRPLLWVIEKQSGEFKEIGPSKICAEKHLYTAPGIPNSDPNSIELSFAKLEGAVKPILQRLQNPRVPPTPEEIAELTGYMALQHTRSKRSIEVEKESEDVLVKLIFRQIQNQTREELKKTWEEMKKGKQSRFLREISEVGEKPD